MAPDALDMSQVYAQFRPCIARYVAARVSNAWDAEDLVSAIFLKVLTYRDSYDPAKGPLSPWIYAIAHNQVADYYKKRRELPLPPGWEDIPSLPPQPDQALDQLSQCLSQLPPRQRSAVVLFYYCGLNHQQIAHKLGVSYANARKICSLGVAALRQAMNLDL